MPGKFCILLSFLIHVSIVAGWFHLAGGLPIPPEPTPAPIPSDGPVIVEVEEEVVEPEDVADEEDKATDRNLAEEQPPASENELVKSQPEADEQEPRSSQMSLPKPPEASIASVPVPPEPARTAGASEVGATVEVRGIKYAVPASLSTAPTATPPVVSTPVAVAESEEQPTTPVTSRSVPVTPGMLVPAPTAGTARRDGLQVPTFSVKLTPDEIDDMLTAGQACLLVVCKDDRFVVQGTTRAPTEITPASSRQLQAFSERALPVPVGYCEVINEQLRWNFSISEDRVRQCQFHLLLNNRLDMLILLRQQASATSLQRRLEDIRHTFGRFEFTGHRVSEFHINAVVMRDGREISLDNRDSTVRAAHRDGLEATSQAKTQTPRGK